MLFFWIKVLDVFTSEADALMFEEIWCADCTENAKAEEGTRVEVDEALSMHPPLFDGELITCGRCGREAEPCAREKA
jgi:hypothetical protein